MNHLGSAFWAELLKARRSLIVVLTVVAFSILPAVAGLFMIILKDPIAARHMGLISAKAQLAAGVADWPAFFGMLLQGTAVAGALIFALITSWIFGSEFSNRTNTLLLALPTSRAASIAAKFLLLALWVFGLTALICLEGLGVGSLVAIPGWSPSLASNALQSQLMVALLTFLLMPLVALLASFGRGYLAPMGWAFFTLAVAQISAVLGWGDWVPWAVPALLSGAAGPGSAALSMHSYVVVGVAFVVGTVATLLWWLYADQSN